MWLLLFILLAVSTLYILMVITYVKILTKVTFKPPRKDKRIKRRLRVCLVLTILSGLYVVIDLIKLL